MPGFCTYCNAPERQCCDVLAWTSFFNDTQQKEYDVFQFPVDPRLSCDASYISWVNITNETIPTEEDIDLIQWCSKFCGGCYFPSNPIDGFASIRLNSGNDFIILFFAEILLSLIFCFFVGVSSRLLRTSSNIPKSWRRFSILPVLEPIIFGVFVCYAILFVVFLSWDSADPNVMPDEKSTCCTPEAIAFVTTMYMFYFVDQLMPIFTLLQVSFTPRAFMETLAECFSIVIIRLGAYILWRTWDFSGLTRSEATLSQYMIGIYFISFDALVVLYICVRCVWNSRMVRRRWPILLYLLGYCSCALFFSGLMLFVTAENIQSASGYIPPIWLEDVLQYVSMRALTFSYCFHHSIRV